ncbi:MAG: DNA translocase FtsK 4TM domain-containing protein, partial [Rikenellaceae bacterium]
MAVKTVKSNTKSKTSAAAVAKVAKDSKKNEKEPIKSVNEHAVREKKPNDNRGIYIAAIMFFSFSLLLFGAVVSYFTTWKYDQSLNSWTQLFELTPDTVQNGMGKLGAITGNLLVGEWFGVFAICIPLIFASFSMVLFRVRLVFYRKSMVSLTMIMFIGSVASAYLFPDMIGTFGSSLGGAWGYKMNIWTTNLFGEYGAGVIIFMFFALWLVYTSVAVVKYMGNSIKLFVDGCSHFVSSLGSFMSLILPKPKPRRPIYDERQEQYAKELSTPLDEIYEIEGDEISQADDENIDSEISLVEPIYQDENEPKQYVPQQTVQSREATILTNDYSQSIDKDNLVIFNPSGFDDITMSSNDDKN